MSDTPTPPEPGQPLWGDDLNTYLLSLEERIAANETRFGAQTDQIADLQQRVGELEQDVIALEAKPEYIYNSYQWMYSNSAPPPTGSQVRFDNADLSLATQAVFRLSDSDGADRTPVFQQLSAGSQIRINDWDDASNIHRFKVTGAANIGDTDVAVPVEWISGNGTLPNAKTNVAFLVALVL